MGSIPLDTALLVSLGPGCILFGIFLVLFTATVYVLLYKHRTPRPNWFLLFASVVMFVFGATYEALSITRVMDAFIVYRDTIGTLVYLGRLGESIVVTRSTLFFAQCLLADFILIYRCRTVWSGRWSVVLFPGFLLLASTAVACVAILSIARASDGIPAYAQTLATWTIAFTSLTLFQNVFVTGLIAWRIWSVSAAANKHSQTSLTPVISLLLETGSLYVATLFVFLMTYVFRSNALYIVFDIVFQMIGITFTLLIVRVGLGLTRGGSSANSSTTTATSNPKASLPVPLKAAAVVGHAVGTGNAAVEGCAVSDLHLGKDHMRHRETDSNTEVSGIV